MRILVTGGAGYIGSHTCIVLLQQGHEVVIVDNLCNSKPVAVQRIQELSGRKAAFYQYDLGMKNICAKSFRKRRSTRSSISPA